MGTGRRNTVTEIGGESGIRIETKKREEEGEKVACPVLNSICVLSYRNKLKCFYDFVRKDVR